MLSDSLLLLLRCLLKSQGYQAPYDQNAQEPYPEELQENEEPQPPVQQPPKSKVSIQAPFGPYVVDAADQYPYEVVQCTDVPEWTNALRCSVYFPLAKQLFMVTDLVADLTPMKMPKRLRIFPPSNAVMSSLVSDAYPCILDPFGKFAILLLLEDICYLTIASKNEVVLGVRTPRHGITKVVLQTPDNSGISEYATHWLLNRFIRHDADFNPRPWLAERYGAHDWQTVTQQATTGGRIQEYWYREAYFGVVHEDHRLGLKQDIFQLSHNLVLNWLDQKNEALSLATAVSTGANVRDGLQGVSTLLRQLSVWSVLFGTATDLYTSMSSVSRQLPLRGALDYNSWDDPQWLSWAETPEKQSTLHQMPSINPYPEKRFVEEPDKYRGTLLCNAKVYISKSNHWCEVKKWIFQGDPQFEQDDSENPQLEDKARIEAYVSNALAPPKGMFILPRAGLLYWKELSLDKYGPFCSITFCYLEHGDAHHRYHVRFESNDDFTIFREHFLYTFGTYTPRLNYSPRENQFCLLTNLKFVSLDVFLALWDGIVKSGLGRFQLVYRACTRKTIIANWKKARNAIMADAERMVYRALNRLAYQLARQVHQAYDPRNTANGTLSSLKPDPVQVTALELYQNSFPELFANFHCPHCDCDFCARKLIDTQHFLGTTNRWYSENRPRDEATAILQARLRNKFYLDNLYKHQHFEDEF